VPGLHEAVVSDLGQQVAAAAAHRAAAAQQPAWLVGLSGWAGCGKDTAAQYLVQRHGFRRVAFADKLRQLAARLDPTLAAAVDAYGWDHVKRHHAGAREYLQTLGVAVRDTLGDYAWVNAALDDLDPGDRVVVTDVRFQNEARRVRTDRVHSVVVRITRPGVTAVNDHPSEHDLDDWPFEHTIVNDGTPDQLGHRLAAALGLEP
jgi:hypothetical protein